VKSLALVALSACGRVGFDPVGDALPAFSFPAFAACPSTIVLDGSAQCANSALELTPDTPGLAGAAWFATQYPIMSTTHISIAITFQFSGSIFADGMTIVLSGDPRGSSALGNHGGSMGYELVMPSAALEFDDNLNPEYGDLNDNHVGIDRDGSLTSIVQQDAAPIYFTNGGVLYAWFDYDGPTTTLAGYVAGDANKPSVPLVTTTDDLSRLGNAWIGLTAATGSDSQRTDVLAWRFDYSP
jgi:hypothetical protein